jgi:hypothetical protein
MHEGIYANMHVLAILSPEVKDRKKYIIPAADFHIALFVH